MGRTTVEPSITLQTDHDIKLCKNVLKTRDVQEAARVRREVCNLFEGVIPGWYGGLMAIYMFTMFKALEITSPPPARAARAPGMPLSLPTA